MIGEYNIQTRNRTHLLTSKQPLVMGGTKGHHKRSDGNTSVRRELPSRRWDIRQGCTPLPYRSIPEIEHGTSHFEDGTCTWVRRVLHTPLAQRWAAHGELSLLLHGRRGGESWSSLPILPKNEMRRTKLAKWMSVPKMDGRRTKLSPDSFLGKG